MVTPVTRSTSSEEGTKQPARRPRDIDYWAHVSSPVLKLRETPAGALNQLDGKQVTGPMKGFGPMWRKTYRIGLPDSIVSPRELVKAWKEHFPSFWPKGNMFYAPVTGIQPGEVALINMDVPGRMKLSTGVMVLYTDEEQFTFITPEGHMLAGWITFSSYAKDGETIAQAEVLVRSPDPIMETILRLGGYRQEDKFWQKTLVNVARYFGVEAEPGMRKVCIDPRVQWSNLRYVRYNIMLRTLGYFLSAPARRSKRQGPR